MFKALKIGVNNGVIILIKPLELIIEIMLENRMINPPISNIVLILLVILSAIISPRFVKLTKLLCTEVFGVLFLELLKMFPVIIFSSRTFSFLPESKQNANS